MRIVLLSLLLASPLAAQRGCDITAKAFDNPFGFNYRGGWRMPRIAWHAVAAGEAVVVTEVAHKAGLRRQLAGWIVPVMSVGVHIVGVATHRYRLNGRDWLFDVAVRTLPLAFQSPSSGLRAYGVAYASTVCWASP